MFCYFPPWVYPVWDSLLPKLECLLSQIREVFGCYLFKYFFGPFLSSPSGTIIVWILVCLMLSQRSLKLSSFLFILISFFLFSISDFNDCSSGSLTHSSESFNLLLIPSSAFSFKVLYSSSLLSGSLKNPYQATNGILHRTRTNNFTICMEIQKTSNSQSDLEKEWNWRN